MSEAQRIADELQRAFDGDPWHGPSVAAALAGVDFALAVARPVGGAHTIAELVVHMTAWTREVTRRLRDGTAADPVEGDWPPVTAADDAQWRATVAALGEANRALVSAVGALTEDDLSRRIGDTRVAATGSGVSRYVTLHGLVQHHAYHAGQIMLLKKAAA